MKQHDRVFFCLLFLFPLVSLDSKAQCFFTTTFNPPNFCTNLFGFGPNENIQNANSPFQILATAGPTGQASICTPLHPSINSLRGSTSGCTVFLLILPVNLISFTGTLNNDHSVSLNWKTTEEKNNAGFEVERSADGHSFSFIGFVSPKNEHDQGSINHYTYKDLFPPIGTHYYRFKQIDHDGSFTYSPVVVATTTVLKKIVVSPNPVTNFLDIQGENLSESSIYTSNGTLLFHTQNPRIDVSQLPAGLYMLRNSNQSVLFIKE